MVLQMIMQTYFLQIALLQQSLVWSVLMAMRIKQELLQTALPRTLLVSNFGMVRRMRTYYLVQSVLRQQRLGFSVLLVMRI